MFFLIQKLTAPYSLQAFTWLITFNLVRLASSVKETKDVDKNFILPIHKCNNVLLSSLKHSLCLYRRSIKCSYLVNLFIRRHALFIGNLHNEQSRFCFFFLIIYSHIINTSIKILRISLNKNIVYNKIIIIHLCFRCLLKNRLIKS